ncbi:MAG: hypothetical protein JWO06_523 [Bacteroidota bacterium]|nr:hypothetical protein [Bacteroidota bacterium]
MPPQFYRSKIKTGSAFFMVRLLLLLAVASFTSCNQKEQKTIEPAVAQQPAPAAAKPKLNTGEVIASVPLAIDAGQTYALYLPKGYSDSARYPAIIFFDPHGDGSLPLNMYHELADKYNYVLIGSNSSKNGMSFDLLGPIANNLVEEARTKYSIDQSKIALCGFSGGAKVAMLNGSTNQYVTNIIYIGAKVDMKPTHPIALLGFAGIKDMNYTDLVSFDNDVNRDPAHTKHYLVQWSGKHEFPTTELIKDAFVFLNTGTVENYEKKKATISEDKLKEEMGYKAKYIKAFQSEDLDWWKNEIAMLNSKKKSDIMFERLLGFLSLACYSIGNSQLQQNNLVFAEKFATIYAMADPGNPDCQTLIQDINRKKGLK